MPRDYAKPSARKRATGSAAAPKTPAARKTPAKRKPSATRKPGAQTVRTLSTGSFVGGMAVGCALTLLVVAGPRYWEGAGPAHVSGTPSAAPTPAPRFEFFDRLPNGEVAADPQAYSGLGRSGAPVQPREFLLQAGSFRRRDDADALRAELLLEGLDASTTEVALGGDDRWFRVLVGPFPTKLETQRAMTRLRERNIAPLLLERPPSAG